MIIVVIIEFKNKKQYDFDIYFFNIGKADSIIIRNKNKYIMIDTGYEENHTEILSYLEKHNITKIDYLIITHFDKDHVGSASYIIDNIEVSNVLQNNSPKDSIYYNNYLESLNNKNIIPIKVEDNYSFDLEDMKVLVEGTKNIYEKNTSNNNS